MRYLRSNIHSCVHRRYSHTQNVRTAGRAAAGLFPDVVPKTVLNDATLLKNVTEVSKDHSLFPWQQVALVLVHM